jgi:hypothetical protein
MVGVKFLRSKLLGDDGDNKARSPGSNCVVEVAL